MAKYLLIAEKTFTDLLRRVGKGLSLPREDSKRRRISKKVRPSNAQLRMSSAAEHFSQYRDPYRELYEKTTGSPVPKGKVVVPKEVHDRMLDYVKKKRGLERRAASMTELDRALVAASGKPGGRRPPELGEKHARTFQNPGFMPTLHGSKRKLPKREANRAKETVQEERRNWEQTLAISGQKAKKLTDEEREILDLMPPTDSLPSLRDLISPMPYKQRYRLLTKLQREGGS